jgi:hypothetical protein
VDRIDGLVHDAYATVAALVQPMVGSPTDVDAFRRADRRVDDLVASDPGYAGYRRMRLESAVEGLATVAAGLCGFPAGSDAGALVLDVARMWAEAMDDRPRGRRADFVETFDTEYPRRRLRFLIALLREMARGAEGRPDPPLRADIESAISDLGALCGDVGAAVGAIASPAATSGAAGRAIRAAGRAFPADRVRDLARGGDRRAAAASLTRESREDVDAAVEAIGALLRDGLPDPPGQGFDTLAHASLGWSREVRRDLMVAYTGFPFWDALATGPRLAGPADAERVVRLDANEQILLLLGEESAGRSPEAVLSITEGEEEPRRPAAHVRRAREADPDAG